MWQEERYQRIRALLSTLQRVTTERLVAELNVSRETVRRDLAALEELGELKRIHGGAVRAMEEEAPLAERAASNVKFKRDLARAAVGLLAHGQTVFVDAGTTTALLAEELARLGGLTVVTNSFDVALKLRTPAGTAARNEVIVLGGTPSERAPATIGANTVAEIARYRADFALISPTAVNSQYGACDYDYRETEVARCMVEHAEQVVILADFSKIGAASRASFCAPERIDYLISNRKAEDNPALGELGNKVKKLILV
jgi:DeoR/GlpR family transcriptional regulator of sugar metabolism